MIEKIEVLYCDICGEKVDSFVRVGESTPVKHTITGNVYYGGTKSMSDICEHCNHEIELLVSGLRERAS